MTYRPCRARELNQPDAPVPVLRLFRRKHRQAPRRLATTCMRRDSTAKDEEGRGGRDSDPGRIGRGPGREASSNLPSAASLLVLRGESPVPCVRPSSSGLRPPSREGEGCSSRVRDEVMDRSISRTSHSRVARRISGSFNGENRRNLRIDPRPSSLSRRRES
jgi:hypothetical protein